MTTRSFFNDVSFASFIAGFTTVLVSITSSIIIVFQAASAVGATSSEISSWVWALGVALGLSSIGLSYFYKIPIVTAWSTPGAAYIALNATSISLQNALGAFLLSGVIIAFLGFSSFFKKVIRYIPTSITSAMLAGILLPFCLKIFNFYPLEKSLILSMIFTYFLAKKALPKYSVLLTLLVGTLITLLENKLKFSIIHFTLAKPIWVAPTFSIDSFFQITIPLVIITMVAQNLVGVSIIQSFGYRCDVNKTVGITGILNTLFAPLGAFAVNLASISASLCLNKDVDQDANKRYTAAIVASIFYLVIAFLGATVTSFLLSLPQALIIGLASLALLPTLIGSLLDAFKDKNSLDSCVLTFFITVSGISIYGLNSILLGLVLGLTLYFFERRKNR